MDTEVFEFINGDRVVWDSGFGYELGIYIDLGSRYKTYKIELIKCDVSECFMIPMYEVKPYETELLEELARRYGYVKLMYKIKNKLKTVKNGTNTNESNT